MPFQSGFALSLPFDNFDEMAEQAAAWDVRYEQLSSGQFSGRMSIASSDVVQLLRASWTTSILQVGSTPQDAWTFGLSLTPDAPTFHRARTLESSSIGLHPPNEELHFVTHGAAEMMVVVIDDSHLTTVLQGRFDMLPHDLSRTGRLRPRSGLAPLERARGLAVILDTVLAKPDDKIIHQRAQECALELMLRDIQPEPERSELRDYSHVARRIEELLRAPRETPLTISQLCALTGVPDRTLHLAFRKAMGTTPASYLRNLRLNAAHRDLRNAASGGVTDIALRHGFFHLGRFAVDYHRRFGERPSDTARRAFPTQPVAHLAVAENG
jgi:AraC family transcriptional regulator, ethanolamine operon transcriptional activator